MKTQKNNSALSNNSKKARKLWPKNKTRKGGAKPNQGKKYLKLSKVKYNPTGKTPQKPLFSVQQFNTATGLMRTIHESSNLTTLDKKIPEDSPKMEGLFAEATKNPYAFYAAVIDKYNSLEPEERKAFAQEAMRFQMNPTISGTMVHKSVPNSKRCTYGRSCIRKNPKHILLAHNFKLNQRLKKCKKFGNPAAFIYHFFTDTC